MIVICHVNQFSPNCETSTCECHPHRKVTGHPRHVRQAQVDFHEGIHFGMPIEQYMEWRQAHV